MASGSISPHGDSPPCLLYADLAGARFESIVCPELLAEIGEAHKPYFSERVGENAADDIVAGIAEAATVLEDPVDIQAVLRDPEDDYLVALAREADAEAIVTPGTAIYSTTPTWTRRQSAPARPASWWACSRPVS